jgi:thiol-disulfide isomerase/thioredoxin
MKKCLLLFGWLLSFSFAFSQTDSVQIPPYKRFPTLPPFQILLSDSASMFTKAQLPAGKPVLFVLFSPECSHCQHETEELIAHRDELKDVEIVMITMHPLWMMKDFISTYGLAQYPNFIVGKDIYFIMPSFYNIHNLPYLAMYNKKGDLIMGFEGSMDINKLIETFRQNK